MKSSRLQVFKAVVIGSCVVAVIFAVHLFVVYAWPFLQTMHGYS